MIQTLTRNALTPPSPSRLLGMGPDRFSGTRFRNAGCLAHGCFHSTSAVLGPLKLDYHTAQFIPESYHSRPIEALFRCGDLGPMGDLFAGRLVPLDRRWVDPGHEWQPGGERWVPVIQQCQSNGMWLPTSERPCFMTPPLTVIETELGQPPSIEQIRTFWQGQLHLDHDSKSGLPVYALEEWGQPCYARFHYDWATGFGCRLWSWGQSDLVDLRVPFEEVAFDGARTQASITVAHRWVDLESATFHEEMEELLRNRQSPEYHALAFLEGGQDGCSLELMGCNAADRNLAHRLFTLLVQSGMGPSSSLHQYQRVELRPWRGTWLEVVDSTGHSKKVRMPPSMIQERKRILKALGCRVYSQAKSNRASSPHVFAGGVRRGWADSFVCQSEPLSGHEVFDAVREFEDLLEGIQRRGKKLQRPASTLESLLVSIDVG